MDLHLLPIGEMSRRSGLTVSALRFYDREAVLPAARVDPVTGYRRYDLRQVRQGRLLAGMRRVSMPLAEMTAVIEAGSDAESVQDLLHAHVLRLQEGLAQARTEVARLTALATDAQAAVVVEAAGLAAALRDVSYAVSSDPELPGLGAVLLEYADGEVRAVATDRYRLALVSVPADQGTGQPVSAVLPLERVAELRRLLAGEDVVELVLTPGSVTVVFEGGTEEVAALEADFPAYRVLVDHHRPGFVTSLDAARAAVASGAQVVRLEDGYTVAGGYLAQALAHVGPGGQLTLPEQLGPLVLADEHEGRLALVMPIMTDPV